MTTLAWLLAGCGGPVSPADEVRETLRRAQQSIEARNVSAVLDFVSDEYQDDRGRDKEQLRSALRGFFVLNPSIHLLARVQSVEFPADELAQARVTVGMLRSRADEGTDDLGLAADLHEFEFELIREGGEWQVRHARWRRHGL